MIDIGNDNLDNELFLEKNKDKYVIGFDPYDNEKESKINIFKNGELIDLRTKDEINFEKNLKYMDNKYNPKELEYWRNIFPNKSDEELEEYRVKWSKENPKYLKFDRL
jgi:hypothetical protein